MHLIASVRRAVLVVAALATGALGFAVPPAQAQAPGAGYLKVGILTCGVGAGVGFLITSNKSLACTFSPSGHAPEDYRGNIRRFGLDLGVTGASVIVWAVFSKVQGYPVGALAGRYGGLSAEATVGVGLGANVLFGGSQNAYALQPLSVQGQLGLDIAAGITQLDLIYTP
jgi:hypothetical protein